MGGSVTKNIVNSAVDVMAKTSSSIINGQQISTEQNQMINVSRTDGDVLISGNHLNQEVNINMEALLTAMSTTEVRQKLAVELAQAAKSITKGINLFQFSNAQNELNSAINAVIDTTIRINQQCASNISQTQSINVDLTNGNVVITDNTMNQLGNIFTKCIQETITNSAAIQDIASKFEQEAVAKSIGFSLWELFMIIAVIAVAMIMGVAAPASFLIKSIFIFVLLAGIVCIVLSFVTTKEEVSFSGMLFSNLLSNTPNCGAIPKGPASTAYETSGLAQVACEKDNECVAFDWHGMDINPDDTTQYTNVSPPQTTFYSEVHQNPCDGIQNNPDAYNMLRRPDIIISSSSDTPSFDTIRIDPQTSRLYTWKVHSYGGPSISWRDEGELLEAFNPAEHSFVISEERPSDSSDKNSIVLQYEDGVLGVWENIDDTWEKFEVDTLSLVSVLPDQINATGFKKVTKPKFVPTLMWIGVGLTIGGLFGTLITQARKSKPVKAD